MKRFRTKFNKILTCLIVLIGISSVGIIGATAQIQINSEEIFSETIVVFDHRLSDWPHPAETDIFIPDEWEILSCQMKYDAFCDPDDGYLRAITFWLDWRGGAIGCYRVAPGQVRGSGTISPGQTKYWTFDMSSCQFATNTSDLPQDRVFWNFIPQAEDETKGYFSPGWHHVEGFVSSQYPGLTQDSWISIRLEFTYKLRVIPAIIDFNPDTLNQKSKGNWVTVYIEFPEEYDVNDIDVSTVKLNDVISAETFPTCVCDEDNDGDLELMVKFDRATVIDLLENGEMVYITITGSLDDETPFVGTDVIRVIH